MLRVRHHVGCACWLRVEWMQLAIGQNDGSSVTVLVEMRERAVSLGDVEAEDSQADRADKLLLERTLLLMRDSVIALKKRSEKNSKEALLITVSI